MGIRLPWSLILGGDPADRCRSDASFSIIVLKRECIVTFCACSTSTKTCLLEERYTTHHTVVHPTTFYEAITVK
jgi:hypothetical protein